MKKILIIDDEPTTVKLLEGSLASAGFEVLTANDGMEGMVLAQKEKPALIIVDIFMPNLDGMAFIQEIKQSNDLKYLSIIVLSGQPGLAERLKQLGVFHYFVKPPDAKKIVEKVKTLTAG